MRFIELHRASDGQPKLINLDEIAEVRPGSDGEHALLEWRDIGERTAMPLLVSESYTEVRGMLAAGRIVLL